MPLRCYAYRHVCRLIAIAIVLFVSKVQGSEVQVIRIPEATPGTYTQYQYFHALLSASLRITAAQQGKVVLEPSSINMVQNRQLMALRNDLLDVMWTVTSPQREEDALAIRVPLIKGLFGYRLLLIHKKNSHKFASIDSIDGLKKFSAVQGFDWPDVDILRGSGLQVSTSNYHNAFKLLAKEYVDYFPRGVTEIVEELNKHQSKDLIIEKTIGLHYQTAIYFFVKKNNKDLHDRITKGLVALKESGDFERIFAQQAFIHDAIYLLDGRTLFELKSQLSEETRAALQQTGKLF